MGLFANDAGGFKNILYPDIEVARDLCEKGAVEAEKRAAFYYRPLLSREEYQRWSTSSLSFSIGPS